MQKFQPSTPRHFSSIDWELIDKIDPLRVVQKGSNEELRSFIRSFCDFRISYEDNSFGHPSSWKLLKLLQISIDYLVEIQEKLAQSIIQKNSTLKRTKKKYKDIKTNYLKALNLAESLQREIDICPICHKKYINGQFVDSHVRKRHPDVYSYWKVIRTKNPSVDEYQEVIDNAKSKINHQTKISISKSVSFDMKTQSIRNEKAEAKGNRNISSIFKSNNDISTELSLSDSCLNTYDLAFDKAILKIQNLERY